MFLLVLYRAGFGQLTRRSWETLADFQGGQADYAIFIRPVVAGILRAALTAQEGAFSSGSGKHFKLRII
jgi:hypothetical protein